MIMELPVTRISPSLHNDSLSAFAVVIGSVRIELQSGFDPQLLRDAVQALC
ncbi:MAG: hypothetical protein K0R28_5944 [Paenibacillus sp.]|jgi:hypothetical protein|nr:hypothetical protein [Paenibacillus sp.]